MTHDPLAAPQVPLISAPAPAPSMARRIARLARRLLLWCAVVVLAADATIERLEPDAMAAVTAIPPWCWLLAAFLLVALGFTAAPWRERLFAVVFLLTFACLTVEQTSSLTRGVLSRTAGFHPGGERPVRVVTLNCCGGTVAAADEVQGYDVDVVLLQESPSRAAVEELARRLFGDEAGIVWAPDCSIIARGHLVQTGHGAAAARYTQATYTSEGGQPIELFCVRLSAPVVRYDLWAASAWRAHEAVRRTHRQEATEIAAALAGVPADRPIILGGDCNAPAGDGALRVWEPRLRDAFAAAGRGWGNTVLNELPVQRFDQLWYGGADMYADIVTAHPTQNSDHRLVVGQFGIPQSR